jgi:type 1 fimbriae regulatory protein FimB/type 1 fimbriae regulatory protein FimE
LRWDQVDLDQALLHVRRRKNGCPSTHPLHEREVKAFRRLQQQTLAPFVFTSERQRPIGTSTVRKIVARAGRVAGLPFPVHPHMLRHPPATSS